MILSWCSMAAIVLGQRGQREVEWAGGGQEGGGGGGERKPLSIQQSSRSCDHSIGFNWRLISIGLSPALLARMDDDCDAAPFNSP